MSLILLFVSTALADRVLWTAPPDAASTAAVARALPGATSAPIDTLVSGRTDALRGDAIDVLRQELAEARPLADEFDGELQIMARLAKATSDVPLLRGEEERNLLRRALLFQGFAVHRYFQDKLGTEAAAAPYRTGAGAEASVTAWLDACALLAAPTTLADEDIPEPAQRLAFDESQALCRSMPSATFIVGDLADGAELRIDGVKIPSEKGLRVRVIPGRHLFHVAVGDTVLLAGDARIKPGADAIVSAPFGPAELLELRGLVDGGDGWTVPDAARMPIQGFGEPVYVATPAGEKTRLLRVDGDVATAVKLDAPRTAGAGAGTKADGTRLVGRGTLGAGWLSTGDFLLLNLEDGAVADRYTVNAGTPAANVAVALEGGLWSVGVGLDAQVTLGENHSLPTGNADTNVFLYPHVAAGLPWAQATVGPLFPWYVGVGARARVPIVDPVELFAAGVYGLPLDRPRADGEPVFEPLPLYTAWGGVTVRVGK